MTGGPQREQGPAAITASLLGTTRLAVGDRQLPLSAWPRKHARMLLLLLLATPGHSLSRDLVLDRLWPEADAETAQNQLHIAAYSLRRVLEPELKSRERSRYLQLTAATLSISDETVVELDVDRFEQLITRAKMCAAHERSHLLDEAIELYQGDLLADEAYVDWPVARREALRAMYRQTLLDRASICVQEGTPLRHLDSLLSFLRTEPADEEFHRAVILAMIAGGRLDAAWKQLEICRAELLEQFDLEPSTETLALFDRVKPVSTLPMPVQASAPVRFRPVPVSLVELVGRSREISDIEEIFAAETARLVTLIGPGGVGKTALALEAARTVANDLEIELAFAGLASIRDHSLLMPEIARAFGIRDESSGDIPLIESIATTIENREVLLLLDNAETILPVAREIAGLLEIAPSLRILVTSRERLRLRGERTLPLAPLATLDPAKSPRFETIIKNDAVRLFAARSRDIDPAFTIDDANAPTISAICHRLDGLPLAIELIASRIADSTPADALASLDRRLDRLRDGPRDLPERLQTMRSAIAWSYDSLSPQEQHLFRALSVFDGGAEIDMAIHVSEDGGLSEGETRVALRGLAEKSLIHAEPFSDPARTGMLETIREYAFEQLDLANETAKARSRHLREIFGIAVAAESGLAGADQIWWLDRIDANLPNIRAALTWAQNVGSDAMALEIAGSIWRYWSIRSDRSEGRQWLNQALAATADTRIPERVTALRGAALLAEDQGDLASTRRCLDEGLRLSEELGLHHRMCQILSDLGNVAHDSGDFVKADELHRRANRMAIEIGFARMVIVTSTNLGMSAYHRGDVVEARDRWTEALPFTETPEQKAILFECLGSAEFDLGNAREAISWELQSLSIWRRLDSRKGTADTLGILAAAHHVLGDRAADAEIQETLDLFRQIGDRRGEANGLRWRAEFAMDRGDLTAAFDDLKTGVILSLETDDPISVLDHLELFARYHLLAGNLNSAVLIWSGCESNRTKLNSKRSPIKDLLVNGISGSLREQLEPSVLQCLWNQASDYTIDQAVAVALSARDSPIPDK